MVKNTPCGAQISNLMPFLSKNLTIVIVTPKVKYDPKTPHLLIFDPFFNDFHDFESGFASAISQKVLLQRIRNFQR